MNFNRKAKGFTVVELIASFALTMIIVVFLFEVLIEVKDIFADTSVKTDIQQKMAIISKNIKNIVPTHSKKVICNSSVCNIDGKAFSIDAKNNLIVINQQKFNLPNTVKIESYSIQNNCVNKNCFISLKLKLSSGNLKKDYNFGANYYYIGTSESSFGITIDNLKGLVKNDGTDGLYEDKYEPGRYIYRGLNPDNYLTFNNETAGWRIVAIEKDNTVKIVKDDDIGSMPFDSSGYRNPSNAGTYCSDSYNGCNAWAANNNLVGSPPMFSVGRNSGTVLKDAEINTYLNTTYYNLIKESDRNKIVSDHEFYVGGVESDTLSINEIANSEASYVWKGKIALLNISDVLKINLNESECTYGSWGASNCYFQNYLSSNNKRFYTLNPTWNGSDNYFLWSPIVTLPYDGGPYSVYASGYRGNDWLNAEVVPTMYLKNNIKLSGSGTKENPYVIIEE